MKSTLLSTLCIIVSAIGVSLTIKADVGMSSVNSLSTTAGEVLNIKVGTLLMIINLACVIIQFILLKKDFHWRNWLQLGVSYLLGEVVNFMMYTVFSEWNIDVYAYKLALFFAGVTLCAFSIAIIIHLNLIVFPLEALSTVVADKYNWQFKHVRQGIDVLALVITVGLIIFFQMEWTVREGTILNMVFLPPCTQWLLNKIREKQYFKSWVYE